MQRPKEMTLFPRTEDAGNILMLFEDGQRIDLTLCPSQKKIIGMKAIL